MTGGPRGSGALQDLFKPVTRDTKGLFLEKLSQKPPVGRAGWGDPSTTEGGHEMQTENRGGKKV